MAYESKLTSWSLLGNYNNEYFFSVITTLNIVFSVTYYLELHNAITIYCISHFLPTKVKLIV